MASDSQYVVDTHALVWYIQADPRLSLDARAALENPAARLILPAIVLAEAFWLIDSGRVGVPSAQDLLYAIDADSRMTIMPLDRSVLERTLAIPQIAEMHDRQIVATALALSDAGAHVSIMTRDADIQGSGLVPVVW